MPIKYIDVDGLTVDKNSVNKQSTDHDHGDLLVIENQIAGVDGKTKLVVSRKTRARIAKPPVHVAEA